MLDLKYSETRINWNPCLQPEIIKLEFVIGLFKTKQKECFHRNTPGTGGKSCEEKQNPRMRDAAWVREGALVPQVVGAWWWLAGGSSGAGRAWAAPAAGRGCSKSLLRTPVMGPGHPNKTELKVRNSSKLRWTKNVIQAQKQKKWGMYNFLNL